ncbi:MAG: GAF domain-containing sensor histidine kinase, partial [Acidimicrobiales bacterium]
MVSLVEGKRLDDVLQRTIEVACQVVGAGEGALDILATGDGGGSFSSGESAGESLTRGFDAPSGVLRVPILVEDGLFAEIRLSDRTGGGSFTGKDRERLVAVATVAGATIERLTLQREQRWGRWVALQNKVASAMLAGSQPDELLALAVCGSRELARADFAAVCVDRPGPGSHLEVRLADGHGAEAVAGAVIEVAGSIFERVLVDGEAHELTAAQADGPIALLSRAGVVGPALLLPLTMEGDTIGVLVVARLAGRSLFTDADRWLVESFVSQLTVALGYGRAHSELRRLAVAADQERIARDLHDTVIQQLYAIGMSLQSVVRSVADDAAAAERLQRSVEALDLTIGDIRATVFALENRPGEGDGLRSKILQSASELCRAYGLQTPRVRFHGLIETMVSKSLAGHVLATVRESVSNAGRHARA